MRRLEITSLIFLVKKDTTKNFSLSNQKSEAIETTNAS